MISSTSTPVEPHRSYKDAPNYRCYRNVGFVSDRLQEIADSVIFEHWGEFQTLAEQAKRQSRIFSSEQQAVLRKHFTSLDFENDFPEALHLLKTLASREDNHLRNAQMLVGEPALTYGPGGGSHCVLHDAGIYTGSTSMPPDTGVRTTTAWSDEEEGLFPPNAEFESVASAYNSYFRSYRSRNEKSGVDNDCLLNQISELILTAIHTRSGWYCLHRPSEAVFVQVDPVQTAETRWLTVRISDIYTPDGLISILDGLRALLQACKVADDNKLKRFGDIATKLIACTAQIHGRSVLGTTTMIEDQKTDDLDNPCPLEKQMSLTSSEVLMLTRAVRGEALLELNPGDLGRFFLVNCCGYLGCGGSGYVVKSCVNEKNFAVKRWSKYEWDIHNAGEGLLDLRYEIEVYAYLHKCHPHVLGRILPRPVAITRSEDLLSESALVLTMVGEHIERKGFHPAHRDESEEEWFVNGEQLSKEEKIAIKKAAKENTKELEALGIVDCDVRGFNIRVEKTKDENGDIKWHVWTIDLGRCRVYLDDEKPLDKEELRALVYSASVD